MDAIKLLQDQHREAEQLFQQFAAVINDPQAKERLFIAIADALAAHCTIEEKAFYPSVFENETEDLLREAVEEHLAVKRVIADLLDMDAEEEQFDAKMRTLQEEMELHIKEEEREMFPKVRKLFEDSSLEELGLQMENLLAELMAEGNPRLQVPEETESAPPLA